MIEELDEDIKLIIAGITLMMVRQGTSQVIMTMEEIMKTHGKPVMVELSRGKEAVRITLLEEGTQQ